MSKAERDAIESTIDELSATLVKPGELVEPQDRPDLVIKAMGLVAGALCDLNRIADALETQAAPQSKEGRDYWDGLADGVGRIASAAEEIAKPPAASGHRVQGGD